MYIDRHLMTDSVIIETPDYLLKECDHNLCIDA